MTLLFKILQAFHTQKYNDGDDDDDDNNSLSDSF